MSRRITTGLTCAALACSGGAFIAGCGDDDEGSGSAATTEAPASTGEAAAPAAEEGAAIEVSMKGNKFVPETVTAKVGQTVTWTNDDGYPHDVVATDGEDFKSDKFAKGTYDYTLDAAGEIKYVCTLHNGMTGTITATE
ncbi:MAG TPA: plastocyanin/azurin family copper-binding protein [Solirubrobacteraceae bacterium]|nr:plastocyanin/azurin family copper-binding protein [Solirubrobacteraceae bacterium]